MTAQNNTPIYQVIIPKHVLKEIEAIHKKDSLKILEKLKQLASCEVSLDVKKLAGFLSLYRLRCGDYRIIYEIFEQKLIIHVIAVGHRGKIYQQLKKLR